MTSFFNVDQIFLANILYLNFYFQSEYPRWPRLLKILSPTDPRGNPSEGWRRYRISIYLFQVHESADHEFMHNMIRIIRKIRNATIKRLKEFLSLLCILFMISMKFYSKEIDRWILPI